MKKIVAMLLAILMVLSLAACASGSDDTATENKEAEQTVEIPDVPDYTGEDTSSIPGLEDGVFTVGMECAYAPYNWMQMDTPTVPCPSPTWTAAMPTAMT